MPNAKPQFLQGVLLLVSPHCQTAPFFPELTHLQLDYHFFPAGEKSTGEKSTAKDLSYTLVLLHEDHLMQSLVDVQRFFAELSESIPVICFCQHLTADYLCSLFPDRPFHTCPVTADFAVVVDVLAKACLTVGENRGEEELVAELERVNEEIKELHAVGIALSAENDPDQLLELILGKSCHITGADAGSLYLVEPDDNLRFKLSRNSSLDWQVRENLVMPIDSSSIAGHVAHSGIPVNLLDAYSIPKTFPFSFNRRFDESSGYRTKSILAVPMKNPAGDILGVIQLLNKRADVGSLVPGQILDESQILPFNAKNLELLSSLASQAAIALENSRLVQDIRNLFEGFVKASIVAIEARDPTTCGHSERVATLTLAFAETLNQLTEGPFKDIHFSDQDLTQLRYAALLHDFGKVGVREEILVKAKKLFPHELEAMKLRFRIIRKSMEADHYRRLLECSLNYGRDRFESLRPAMEASYRQGIDDLEETLAFLIQSNEPTILEEGNFKHLLDISKRQYVDIDGQTTDFLNSREAHVLAIRKGSLSEAERMEIESHVTHTFNFLSKIPWTRGLKRVPDIAYAHHEKLNGRGYPSHLSDLEIPLEAKLMMICDIFDALTAQDRPYKPALPRERAFDIMRFEVKNGLLPAPLLEVFVESKVYTAIDDKPFRL